MVGLYFALIASRPDYQQGETVRIMYIHVFAAWIAIFCMCLGGACLGRGADLAPSAGRCRGGGGLSAGCGLPASGPGLRLALGPADVGHLLGLGGAPQFIPAAVLDRKVVV